MALIATEHGKQALITNALALEVLELRLFTDDRRPRPVDTVKSFTELKDSGYTPIQLPADKWILAAGSILTSGVHVFTFSGLVKAIFGSLGRSFIF